MPTLETIERNINKMRSMGASEQEVNIYKQGALQQAQGGQMAASPQVFADVGQAMSGQTQSPAIGGLELQGATFGKTPSFKFNKPTLTEEEKSELLTQRQAKIQSLKKMKEEEAAYQGGKSLINNIERMWIETTPPSSKSILKTQPLYGIAQRIGAPLQKTENQRRDYAYVRFIKSLRSRLAKGAIGQDVGNLSEYEQRVVTEGVPGLTDNYETGKLILKNLNKTLIDMKEARKQGWKSLDDKLIAEGRELTPEKAKELLQRANGDKEKARSLAIKEGWAF